MSKILLKLLPWYLLLTVALCGGAWGYGHYTATNSRDTYWSGQLAQRDATIDAERLKASEDARAAEQKHAAALAAATDAYQEGLKNAKADSDRLVADLRAGNVKLQDHWRACVAAADAPASAASTAGADAATRLRAAGEEAILADIAGSIRDGAEADATIRALQAIVIADREALKEKP